MRNLQRRVCFVQGCLVLAPNDGLAEGSILIGPASFLSSNIQEPYVEPSDWFIVHRMIRHPGGEPSRLIGLALDMARRGSLSVIPDTD